MSESYKTPRKKRSNQKKKRSSKKRRALTPVPVRRQYDNKCVCTICDCTNGHKCPRKPKRKRYNPDYLRTQYMKTFKTPKNQAHTTQPIFKPDNDFMPKQKTKYRPQTEYKDRIGSRNNDECPETV